MAGPRLTGPKLTAPAATLARRFITTTSNSGAVPQATTLITSSRAAAPLAHKYAELLKEKNLEGDVRDLTADSVGGGGGGGGGGRKAIGPGTLTPSLLQHSRHIYTRSANRPHPPPRRMRLMQTFTSSAARPARSDTTSIDFMVLPNLHDLQSDSAKRLRVPILPDNYNTHHAPIVVEEPVLQGQINVVAADPEKVSVAALTEVEPHTLDGVELKFAHETPKQAPEPGMLKDLWKGLVDDVLGGSNKGKFAV